ncbi:MAG: type II restriction endonuclease [Pacificimonas sp.]|jgi:hypothetical protein|nr:type II restriction endonuclease [Pacificimonas sp.]
MPSDLVNQFKAESLSARKLFSNAKKMIPSATDIAAAAISQALSDRLTDREYLKSNFSDLVSDIQIAAYNAYLSHERKACGEVLGQLIDEQLQAGVSASVKHAVTDRFFTLDRFFLSLTQSRRVRAGKAFEAVVTALFDALGYPHTPQPVIGESQPDYVLPSIEHYENFSTDCLIFTCKRTLRERWRQVVTEGMAGQAFFLATIDEGLSKPELKRMQLRNVIVVVPKAIKDRHYSNTLNVIGFEAFFEHHLDPAMARWTANGAI